MSDQLQAAQALVRKLGQIAPLSSEEKEAIVGAWAGARLRALRSGEDVVREGEAPGACSLVCEGLLCRYKLPSADRRQITGFAFAGDLCGLDGQVTGQMDHGIAALTPATVAMLPWSALDALTARHPGIARALWRDTLSEAAIAREWIANVGQRSARERIAHLMCEMRCRLEAAGLADGDAYDWPVTQAEVADATGMSVVHVNRTLKQLRTEGLATFSGQTVRILDWEGLRRAGEFSPDYLGLGPAPGSPGPAAAPASAAPASAA